MSETPELVALQLAANLAIQETAFKASVLRHCTHLPQEVSVDQFKVHIHPDDQMLLHSIRHFGEVNRPASQYFNVALQQHQAAQQILRSVVTRVESAKVLDFACGFGRLLRFLSLSLPKGNVWAAEIQSDALDFVGTEFGVHTLQSHPDPADFVPAERFDFIWVASLFSHLPDKLFRAWLDRLHAVLAPNGVLCFSVHDQQLLPPGRAMAPEGIHFIAQSENADLDTCIYGTTYVSESYVRRMVAEVTGSVGGECVRLPRALANEQDIYVVAAGATAAILDRLKSFRRGAWGWVDGMSWTTDHALLMNGWAASLDDGPLDTVQISIDGQVHHVPTGQLREDVGRVLCDVRLNSSGWSARLPLPDPGSARCFVEVSACSVRGERSLLYAGYLNSPNP